MKKILFCLYLLCFSITAYSQHKYIQNLDWQAQITFPDTPKTEFNNQGVYYLYRNNVNYIYAAQVLDININPDLLNKSTSAHAFEYFIDNTITPLKGFNLRVTNVKKDSVDGVKFSFTCAKKGIKLFGYQQAFIVNNKLISYSIYLPDSLSENDLIISSYFDSFKFTKERAKKMNRHFSKIAAIIMLCSSIFVVSLIVYIVKRSKRKSKKVYNPDNFR